MSFEIPLHEALRQQLAEKKDAIAAIQSDEYKKAEASAVKLVVDAIKERVEKEAKEKQKRSA